MGDRAPAVPGPVGRRGHARARIVPVVAVALAMLSACSGSPAAGPTGPSTTVTGLPGDADAIRHLIEAINATAGGPVTGQRAALERLVDPSDADEQRDCPVARHTLRLDPVYSDLRRPPTGSASGSGTSAAGSGPATTAAAPTDTAGRSAAATAPAGSGTAYLLPTLITIFTGDRITGTDLTTLRLFVGAGGARIGPLCVN